jgi:hypothetical protein
LGEIAPQLIQSASARRLPVAESCRRIRRHVGQQRRALVERAEQPLPVQSELHVEPLERRQVHFGLLRQTAGVLGRVHRDVTFTAGQLPSGLLELRFQELRRPGGFVRSHLPVLRNVEVGDRIRHCSNRIGMLACHGQPECDGLAATAHLLGSGQVDFDVVSQLRERRVAIAARPEGRVEIESFDQAGEVGPAQHLLLNDVQPALELTARNRSHHRVWQLPLDEHDRRCAKEIRQK